MIIIFYTSFSHLLRLHHLCWVSLTELLPWSTTLVILKEQKLSRKFFFSYHWTFKSHSAAGQVPCVGWVQTVSHGLSEASLCLSRRIIFLLCVSMSTLCLVIRTPITWIKVWPHEFILTGLPLHRPSPQTNSILRSSGLSPLTWGFWRDTI